MLLLERVLGLCLIGALMIIIGISMRRKAKGELNIREIRRELDLKTGRALIWLGISEIVVFVLVGVFYALHNGLGEKMHVSNAVLIGLLGAATIAGTLFAIKELSTVLKFVALIFLSLVLIALVGFFAH